MLRCAVALGILSVLAGCAAPPPLGCTSAVDGSGRGLPVCNSRGNIPVCDALGATAHFNGSNPSSLTDGTLAVCDTANQLVCGDRTVMPRCEPLPMAPAP